MQEYDFNDSPGYWLCHTSHVYQRALTKQLSRFGITAQHFQVLMWLTAEGQLSQTDLAERVQIDDATMSAILRRMERDGWIYRQESPDDRRKKIVRPMSHAYDSREKLVECAQHLNQQAVEGIDPNHLKLFQGVLTKIRENIHT